MSEGVRKQQAAKIATMTTMDSISSEEELARPSMDQVQQLARELDEVDDKLAQLQQPS